MDWQGAEAYLLRAVLISLAAPQGKRKHFGKLPFQRSFNFGLLSIASYAIENGHDVEVWDMMDPDFKDEWKFASALQAARPNLVGISCISGFTYPSLLSVSKAVKKALPDVFLVVGGKDHVGNIPNVVLDEVPELNAVVSGYGEEPFLALLDSGCHASTPQIPGVTFRGQPCETTHSQGSLFLPFLNYGQFHNYRSLPPSLEIGRGCPFHCLFCSSAESRFVRRTPEELAAQMYQACVAYDDPNLRIYLEAPLATFSRQYLLSLRKELGELGISPTWRTECRVDSLNPGLVDMLAEAGCRVLDLGLESASPKMLEWMKKGIDPLKYLQSSSTLLPMLASAGIFSKVNILFFAGENHETLNSTYEYLDKQRKNIGAIAAGPLFLYPGIAGESRIREILCNEGGGVVETADWLAKHIAPISPSHSLGYDELIDTSIKWERDFQSAYSYWYHRQWGYFTPNVSYKEFAEAVGMAGTEHFPFDARTLGATGKENDN